MAIRLTDLSPQAQLKAMELSGHEVSPKPAKASAKNSPKATADKIAEARNRPPHAVAMLAAVAVLGYSFMGIGWLIGAVGDAIWYMGVEMHERKWNVR